MTYDAKDDAILKKMERVLGETALVAKDQPRTEALASGAMIQTAQAHDEVLVVVERVEAIARTLRDAIEKKRREADSINREMIDLCAKTKANAEALEKTLLDVGKKLIEQKSA